jgi:hypothetical protein
MQFVVAPLIDSGFCLSQSLEVSLVIYALIFTTQLPQNLLYTISAAHSNAKPF